MNKIAKKITLLTSLCLSTASFSKALAQQSLGIWLTEKKDAKVEILSTANGLYEGKIIWLNTNTSEAKALIGTAVLRKLKKVNDNKYEGKAFEPLSKKEYNCTVTLKNATTLVVRGYIGIFGSSQNWTATTQ